MVDFYLLVVDYYIITAMISGFLLGQEISLKDHVLHLKDIALACYNFFST